MAAGTSDVVLVLDPVGCQPERAASPAVAPPTPIVWDDRIALLGWDAPRRARLGEPFVIVTYFKVLKPVDRPWKVFTHLEGTRGKGWVNADHEPVNGRCAVTAWNAGDVIIDRITTAIPNVAGDYRIWIGFFRGSPGAWQNLPLSAAPAELRDGDGRLGIATITAE